MEISKAERTFALSLIVLGLALRVWIWLPTDLWEDEVIATTHAVMPFWQIFVACLRFDIHPPLFFLQLHVWGLISHSDIWLTLNPLVWSIAAIASLWWVGKSLYGARIGLLAATIFAILPSPTFMADQLRMYSMLATLIIWLHYFAERNFRTQTNSFASLAAQAVLTTAVATTHAIGFVAVLLSGLYTLQLLLARQGKSRELVRWVLIYGVSALFAAPWIAGDVLRDANLSEHNDALYVFRIMAQTAIGTIGDANLFFVAVGTLFFAIAVAVGLRKRATRPMTLIFLVLPIVLCVVLAVLFKPFFKWNIFSTIEAPFLALFPAIAMAQRSDGRPSVRLSSRAIWLCGFCALLLAGASVATRLMIHISSGYRDDADLIRANFQPGDIVYAPQVSIFEGIAWYLVGPDYGSQLAIAPAPTGPWRSLYDHLGPGLVNALHLAPSTQMLVSGRYKVLIGNGSAGQARGAPRIWLVYVRRADLVPGYPSDMLDGLPQQWSDHVHTEVALYAATPQKIITLPRLAP